MVVVGVVVVVVVVVVAVIGVNKPQSNDLHNRHACGADRWIRLCPLLEPGQHVKESHVLTPSPFRVSGMIVSSICTVSVHSSGT